MELMGPLMTPLSTADFEMHTKAMLHGDRPDQALNKPGYIHRQGVLAYNQAAVLAYMQAAVPLELAHMHAALPLVRGPVLDCRAMYLQDVIGTKRRTVFRCPAVGQLQGMSLVAPAFPLKKADIYVYKQTLDVQQLQCHV